MRAIEAVPEVKPGTVARAGRATVLTAGSTRRGLLLLLAAMLLVSASAGCRMERDGPDFRRYSKTHRYEVRKATHRAGDLELTVLSGTYSEVYTVLGSESWTARIDVRLVNRGSEPLTVPMDAIGAIQPGSGATTAVYFGAVTLPPGK